MCKHVKSDEQRLLLLAEVIATDTLNNGGYSSPYMSGRYAVSKANSTVRLSDSLERSAVVAGIYGYLQSHGVDPDTAGLDATGTYYVGTWVEGGMIWMDHSRGYDNECDAIAFAVENNQVAIYDRRDNVEIQTGGTGENIA